MLRHVMVEGDRIARRASIILLMLAIAIAPNAGGADLQLQTLEAFNRYVSLAEAQIDSELANPEAFLWIERLPENRRTAAYAELHDGHVVIERLETLDQGKHISVSNGMIHHWIGTVFIPGATLAQTLSLEEDYDHHQEYFRPDVTRSKILRRNGNDFLVLMRLRKKKIITTIFDTEHEVHYALKSQTRAWSRSRTTRIQQVDNAGLPSERLKPEEHDDGFLWRMNTYWRFEEKDGGTYVECQSISLTRDIPAGLGWMIGPFVTSIPRESLTFTLATTRAVLLQRIAKPISGLGNPKAAGENLRAARYSELLSDHASENECLILIEE
jgi:hypothetical protein